MSISKADLYEFAGRHARMVEVCLRSRERAKAHAAVDRMFDELEKFDCELTINDPLSLVLNTQIANILESNGIRTIAELCEHSREELIRMHQMRDKSAFLIERSIQKHGFKLRRD